MVVVKNDLSTVSTVGDCAGSKLKLVILSWSETGGAGVAAYRLHKALLRYGVDSTMLVLHKKTDDPSVIRIPVNYAGVVSATFSDHDTCDEKMAKNFKRWREFQAEFPRARQDRSFFSDIFSEVDLYRIKEIKEADIVNVHWIAGVINYRELPFSLSGKPVFWTLHDMNPFTGGCHYVGDCIGYQQQCGACKQLGSKDCDDVTRNFFSIKQKVLANLDLSIVTPSVWLGKYSEDSLMLKKFPHTVIPYCLPTDIFKPQDCSLLRSQIGASDGDFIVLAGAVSLHEKRKGFFYIIEMFRRMAGLFPSRKICLMLYGGLKGEVELPSEFSVIKLGFINEPEMMAKAYNLADLYIIPSLEDNLPNVVLESMACGTPVLGFRTGGIPDMIEHQKTGYLVDQKDVSGLVKGVEWALSLRGSYNLVRQRCRDRVLKLYSEKVIAEKYYELFLEKNANVVNAKQLFRQFPETMQEQALKTAMQCYPYESLYYKEAALLACCESDSAKALEFFKDGSTVNPSDEDLLTEYGNFVSKLDIENDFVEKALCFMDVFPENRSVREVLIDVQINELKKKYCDWQDCTMVETSFAPVLSVIVLVEEGGQKLENTVRSVLDVSLNYVVEFLLVISSLAKIDNPFISELNSDKVNFRVLTLPKVKVDDRVAVAANIGMCFGRGHYCLYLYEGDLIKKLDCFIAKLENEPAISVVYGDSYISEEGAEKFKKNFAMCNEENLYRPGRTSFFRLKKNYGMGPHPVWRRELYLEIGFWDERQQNSCDQDFWLRVTCEKNIEYIPLVIGRPQMVGDLAHQLPLHLIQDKALDRKYRTCSLAGKDAREQRKNDIVKYIHGGYDGLKKFLSDLTKMVEAGLNNEAIDLYDRVRWEMIEFSELKQVDEFIEKVRKVTINSLQ